MTLRRTGIETVGELRAVLADWPDDAPVCLADGARVVVEVRDGDSPTPVVFLTDLADYEPDTFKRRGYDVLLRRAQQKR